MKILTNGCSFTARSPFNTWPYLLGTDKVKNLAQHNAGNIWICDSTIAELSENDYDMVLIMWSGLCRVDAIVDEEAYTQHPDHFKSINNFGIRYVHLGVDNKSTLRYVSERELVFQSMGKILHLQSFLTSNHIPYCFMSYMNFWDLPAGYGFDLITNQFDFDNWIFLDEDRNGLYELSQDQKLYIEDRYHPNETAHQYWADIIRERINA